MAAVPDASAAGEPDSDEHAIAAPAGMCRFTEGGSESESTLIIGNLLTGMDGAQYGAVLVSGGRIVELVPEDGIESAALNAAIFDCGRNFVSPGLINPHEHTRYSFQMLTARDREKLPVYAHRDEWIPESGFGDGADKIRYQDGTDDAKTLFWIELRHLLAGTTLIAGSGAVRGLAKNAGSRQRLEYEHAADMRTFPFGPEAMQRIRRLRSFPDPGTEAFRPDVTEDLPPRAPYVPHVAEGTDLVARLEGRFFLDYVATRKSHSALCADPRSGPGFRRHRKAGRSRRHADLVATLQRRALRRNGGHSGVASGGRADGHRHGLVGFGVVQHARGTAMRGGAPRKRVGQPGPVFSGLVANGHRQRRLRTGARGRHGPAGSGAGGRHHGVPEAIRRSVRRPAAHDGGRKCWPRSSTGGCAAETAKASPAPCRNGCRFTVGPHFVCAELPDAARGLPFEFAEVLQANRKEDIVPLYRENHQPFPNQAECAVRTRAQPES